MVVDSFLDDEARPVALAYLDKISVSPDAIELVVASHFDDDHIGGLIDVIDAASPDAQVWFSSCLRSADLLAWASVQHGLAPIGAFSSGTSTFIEAADSLPDETLNWAMKGHTLDSHGGSAVVRVIAPSHTSFKDSLAEHGFKLTEYPARYRGPTPNATSVVLYIKAGAHRVILGGDLPSGRGNRGWQAIIKLGLEPAKVFKVPHHGAVNSWLQEVDDGLVLSDAVRGLTRYTASGHPLPRPGDVERLQSASGATYVIGKPSKKADWKSAQLRALAERATVNGVWTPGPVGQLQLRWKEGSDAAPTVAEFGWVEQL